MPKTSAGNHKDLLAQAAAYLLCLGNRPKEIERALHRTQSEVSKLLRRAEQQGWLFTTPRLGSIPEDSIRIIEQQYILSHTLRSQLTVRTLRVLDAQSMESFGKAAAVHVGAVLQQAHTVGIAWGRVMASVVNGLRTIFPPHPTTPLTFFPVRGELIHKPLLAKESPSTLASLLDEIVNGGTPHTLSLASVPAIIPATPRAKSKILRAFFEGLPSYQAVRQGSTALLTHADAILTSAGPADAESVWSREALALGGIRPADLRNLVIGDIAGVLIPKQGLRATQRKTVGAWNRRWLGITSEDLQACADRAVSANRAGVILVATSASRAEIVRACCRAGIVTELIIDVPLAQALSHSIKHEKQ